MFSKKFDIIAIGDTVTDAFIRLKEARVNCNIDNTSCQICMKFGDKIPFESSTVVAGVGNSANAAVSAGRLGLKTALVTDLGHDRYADEAIQALEKSNVDTTHVRKHKNMKTNYHYVLWYGSERTILVNHEEYPYTLPRFSKNPSWVYLSSLGANSYEYHLSITKWLEANPDIKLVFQPGTFQMSLGLEKLKDLYKRTNLFFCNREEAQRILGIEEPDIKKLMARMREQGPKIVVITDGPDGAYAFDGDKAYFMPTYPDPKEPLERTGAGDAFSSTFAAAIVKGKTLEEALIWGPVNSASVVQDIGAQKGLLTEAQLKEWLAKAPVDYKPRLI